MKKRYANGVNNGINKYYQKVIDKDYFKGYICLVKVQNVEKPYIVNNEGFDYCILDQNYEWLEIYPDNENYAITVMYDDKKNLIQWYFDMIKKSGLENGIPYIEDLYLDLVIKSNGNQIVLDEIELKEVLDKKEITKEEYDMAYSTMSEIKEKYGNNLSELIELTEILYNEFFSLIKK